MSIANELITKYKLEADSYYLANPYEILDPWGRDVISNRIEELQIKYQKYVPARWYGLRGLSYPIPLVWLDVIDEYLQYATKECPDLHVLQVKVKYGGIRLYLDNWTDDVRVASYKLGDVLYDSKLIY